MNSRIAQLASIVNTNVLKVSSYLEDNHLPMPSFDVDGPLSLNIQSEDVQNSRDAALEAMMELSDLLHGPLACMLPDWNMTSLQVIHRHDIARKVPLEGSISIPDLAAQCSLQPNDLKRVLRYAITWHRLFAEPQPGFIAHSAGSKAMATDEFLRAAVGSKFDEFSPSFARRLRTAEALEKFTDSEPNHTGFALAHDTDKTLYGYLGQNPEKAVQFAKSMKALSREGFDVSFTVDSYDWGTIQDTLVDVGGADGHVSIALAQAYPDLNFIVQDLPHVTNMPKPQAEPLVKAGRMSFQSYDFFTVQPVVASAYLFRGMFHSWPDHYVVRVLKNMVPALRPGSRVLLNETLSPEPGALSLNLQRRACYMDMLLMSLYNARQRTAQEWQRIFDSVDPRFGTVKVFQVPRAAMSVLEIYWEG